MHNFKQPIYSLKVEANVCNYQIYVNDFKIFNEFRGFPLNSEFNFNEWIYASVSNVKMIVSPMPGQQTFDYEASVTISVFCRDKSDTNHENKIEVAKLATPVFSASSPVPFAFNVSFPTSVPFLTQISNASVLKLEQKLIDEAIKVYKEIHILFSSKDIAAIEQKINTREDEYAGVYYDSPSERKNDTLKKLIKYFGNLNLEVWELALQHFTPKLYCGGRIITMEDSRDFSPIFMVDRKERSSVSFPFYFMISKENNEFLVIR